MSLFAQSRFVTFLESSLIFAKQSAFPEKNCTNSTRQRITCKSSKSLVYLSKIHIYANAHVSAITTTSPCLIGYKQESQYA